MSKDTAMIEILGTILSRLVNVALFIIITILALVFLRENVEMNLALIARALIAMIIGVVGTLALRYLFKLLQWIGGLLSDGFDRHRQRTESTMHLLMPRSLTGASANA